MEVKVPVEKIVEVEVIKEIIKEVQVPVEKEVIKEVIKEVEKVVIERVEEVLKYSSYEAINRYPKIRVLQGSTKYIYGLEVVR